MTEEETVTIEYNGEEVEIVKETFVEMVVEWSRKDGVDRSKRSVILNKLGMHKIFDKMYEPVWCPWMTDGGGGIGRHYYRRSEDE